MLSTTHTFEDPKELKRVKKDGLFYTLDNNNQKQYFMSILPHKLRTKENQLISSRHIGMFGGMSKGFSWENSYGSYHITDKDRIIFMSTEDMFLLGKVDVIINRICSLYGSHNKIEEATDKFNEKLLQRIKKLGLSNDELDICYTLTFIYKASDLQQRKHLDSE